jgi:transposase
MRFVPVKIEKQQTVLVLHRSRDLLMRQRTMILNAIRSHCAEFLNLSLNFVMMTRSECLR